MSKFAANAFSLPFIALAMRQGALNLAQFVFHCSHKLEPFLWLATFCQFWKVYIFLKVKCHFFWHCHFLWPIEAHHLDNVIYVSWGLDLAFSTSHALRNSDDLWLTGMHVYFPCTNSLSLQYSCLSHYVSFSKIWKKT